MSNIDYVSLNKIKKAVSKSTDNAKLHFRYLRSVDDQIEETVNSYLNNKQFNELYRSISKIDKTLANQLKELMNERNSLIEGLQVTREQLFNERLSNVDRFTIMLFGRTMAGKSTTIQALFGENLNIQGNGTPDWTSEITEYDWNGIKIVDTPGIEGFDESNFDIAENYIERADIVLMVISDDHIEPILIEKIAQLITENKPFGIILNIKAGNPNLAFKRPEKVIRQEEVDGHITRIRDYLNEYFINFTNFLPLEQVPIFPVFVEGAYRAQLYNKNDISEDDKSKYEHIYKCSRFDDVTKYIINTIISDSAILKTKSAYDSFTYRLGKMEATLKSKVFPLLAQKKLLIRKRPIINRELGALKKQLVTDFEIIKSIFYTLDYGIDEMVDQYIIDGAKGNLHKQYEDYLDWESIEERIIKYRTESVKFLNNYMMNFEEDLGFDLNLVSEKASKSIAYETDIDREKLKNAKLKKNTAKVIKTAGRTAAAVGPGALLTWGVANFWNPSGWAAIGAAVGVVIVGSAAGYYGSEGVKQLGEKLDKSGDRDIADAKKEVTQEFKKDLNKSQMRVIIDNQEWLDKIYNHTKKNLLQGIDISIKESNVYVNETFGLINGLDAIRNDILIHEIEFIFNEIMGKEVSSKLAVLNVVRKNGRRMKIAIAPTNGKCDIMKIALGNDYEHIRKLRKIFGKERIDLVPFDTLSGEWGTRQVIKAFGVKSISEERVEIKKEGNRTLIHIKDCVKKEMGLLYDRYKVNHQLCEALFKCRISFEEV